MTTKKRHNNKIYKLRKRYKKNTKKSPYKIRPHNNDLPLFQIIVIYLEKS